MDEIQELFKRASAQLGEVLINKESVELQLGQLKRQELELRLQMAELRGRHAELSKLPQPEPKVEQVR